MLRNKINKGAYIVASALFGVLGFGSMAQATSTDDLQKQIDSLRDQVEQESNKLKINGFLSAGIAGSDVAAATDTGISEDHSFTSDSVVGVQFDFNVGENTNATVQFVGRGNENFNAQVEWAYIDHQFNDNYSVQAGRLRLPTFMVSEYLEIGMAYPWVRPPSDLYELLPFSYYDGIALTYDFTLGSVDSSLQILTGNSKGAEMSSEFGNLEPDFDIDMGLHYVASVGNWAFHLSYIEADASLDTADMSPQLLGMIALLDMLGVEDTSFEELKVDYSNLGLTFDNGKWLVQSEILFTSSSNLFVDMEAYYISVAHRFGKWMPYIMASHMADGNNDEFEDIAEMIAMIPANPMLPDPVGTAAGFSAVTREAQKSGHLGIGYDLMPNVKLKAEWRYIEVEDDTKGAFSSTEFYADPFEHANIYSVVVDAVF